VFAKHFQNLLKRDSFGKIFPKVIQKAEYWKNISNSKKGK